MKFIKGFSLVLVILSGAIVVSFVSFAVDTFSFRQRPEKTDAIVVLTGGRGRVEEGVRLYKEKQGNWLFLIGVAPSVRKGELFRDTSGTSDVSHVVLEKVSRNTLENAVYARDLLIRNNIGSIRLLTSRYHMNRAVLIFRNLLPKDIAIYPHPVDTRNLRETWWSHGSSMRLLFSEYYKYCLYRIFFLCGGAELRGIKAGS